MTQTKTSIVFYAYPVETVYASLVEARWNRPSIIGAIAATDENGKFSFNIDDAHNLMEQFSKASSLFEPIEAINSPETNEDAITLLTKQIPAQKQAKTASKSIPSLIQDWNNLQEANASTPQNANEHLIQIIDQFINQKEKVILKIDDKYFSFYAFSYPDEDFKEIYALIEKEAIKKFKVKVGGMFKDEVKSSKNNYLWSDKAYQEFDSFNFHQISLNFFVKGCYTSQEIFQKMKTELSDNAKPLKTKKWLKENFENQFNWRYMFNATRLFKLWFKYESDEFSFQKHEVALFQLNSGQTVLFPQIDEDISINIAVGKHPENPDYHFKGLQHQMDDLFQLIQKYGDSLKCLKEEDFETGFTTVVEEEPNEQQHLINKFWKLITDSEKVQSRLLLNKGIYFLSGEKL